MNKKESSSNKKVFCMNSELLSQNNIYSHELNHIIATNCFMPLGQSSHN